MRASGTIMKRGLSLLLCGVLLLGQLGTTALAAENPEGAEPVEITRFAGDAAALQTVPLNTAEDTLDLPTALDVYTVADDTASVPIDVAGWDSAPAYDPATAGDYTFTPTLPEGYTLAAGVSLPEFPVRVSDAPAASPYDEVVTLFRALPPAAGVTEDTSDAEKDALMAQLNAAWAGYDALSDADRERFDADEIDLQVAARELNDAVIGEKPTTYSNGIPTDVDGTTLTLQAAIDAATSGDTLKITADIDLGSTGVNIVGKGITIDLNGQMITYSGSTHAIFVGYNGLLTVKDTATDGKIQSTAEAIRNHYASSQTNILGGKIESTSSSGTIYNEGTVNVSGGTVEITGSGNAIQSGASGTVNISGGTVQKASAGDVIYFDGDGTITVSGGTVKSTSTSTGNAIYNNSNGTITVSGGTVESTSTGNAIYNNSNGTITVSDGMVKSTGTRSPIYNKGAGAVNVSGGTVQSADADAISNQSTGTVSVSGGTISASGSSQYAISSSSAGTVSITGTPTLTGGEATIKLSSPLMASGYTGDSITIYWDGSKTDGTPVVNGGATTPSTDTFSVTSDRLKIDDANHQLVLQPTYRPYVKLQKDGALWTASGKTVALYSDTASPSKIADLTQEGATGSYDDTLVDAGTYRIYVDGADTGMKITGTNSYTRQQVDYYTVSFDLDGGTAPINGTGTGDQIILKGQRVTAPDNPTKAGNTFAGWFTGTGSSASEFDFATDTIARKTTLTAHWTLKTTKEATPSIRIDYEGEELTDFVADAQYGLWVEGVESVKRATADGTLALTSAGWDGSAKTIKIVKKGIAASSTTDSDALPLTIPKRPDAPSSVTFSFDSTDPNKLMGSTAAMEYKLDGGTSWTPCTADIDLTSSLSSITTANGIQIRVKATGASFRSLPQAITIFAGAAVPSTVAAEDCTTAANNDGKLTGVTTAMEYRKGASGSWTTGTSGGNIEGLAPGDYNVRNRATGQTLAGAASSFTVGAFKSYSISLSQTDEKVFPDAIFGYSPAPDALTVTVTNTGNQATGPLTVALSGTESGSFTLNPTTGLNSIAVGDTATFAVTPNTGLDAKTHTATVTVSSETHPSITATFDVSFTVNPAKLTKPTISGDYPFNNAEQTVTPTGFDSATMNISNNTRTNAGSQDVTVSLKYPTNYEWDDGTGGSGGTGDLKLKWTILPLPLTQPAKPTISTATPPTYDSITVTAVSGQKYACTLATATSAPAITETDEWKAPVSGATYTFSGLTPNTAYKLWTYQSGDTNHTDSPVSEPTERSTLPQASSIAPGFTANTYQMVKGGTTAFFALSTAPANTTYKIYAVETGGTQLSEPRLSITGTPSAVTLTYTTAPADDVDYYISATESGKTESSRTPITVKAYVPVTSVTTTIPSPVSLQVGGTTTVTATVLPDNATDKVIVWSSGNTAAATVNPSTGKVTAVAAGTATITGTSNDNSSKTVTITVIVKSAVQPTPPAFAVGGDEYQMQKGEITATFTLTATPAVGTTFHIYAANLGGSELTAPTVRVSGATVTLTYATAPTDDHTYFISSKDSGGTESSRTEIRVKKYVAVTSVTPTAPTLDLKPGGTGTVTATVQPSGATDPSITWSSGNPSVVTVDPNTGVVTGGAPGTAIITGRSNDDPSMTITITVTVTSSTGGGSSGGGGSSSGGSSSNGFTPPVIVAEPDEKKPDIPTTAGTGTTVKPDSKGEATVTIPSGVADGAIKKAQDEAKKNGESGNGVSVQINLNASGAGTVTVNLPMATQEKLIAAKVDDFTLAVNQPDIAIGFNLDSMEALHDQANADVQVSVTRIADHSALSNAAKTAIGTRPVFELNASYKGGKVTSFGDGSVRVEFPYTLKDGEIAGNLCAVYVDDNGKVAYLENSSYDPQREVLTFTTDHFSVYGVGYRVTFDDIQNHWAKVDIEFVAQRGLLNGTSATTFSPDTSMSRGMFVTALGRLAGIDPSSYKTSTFSDVPATAYYAPYVEWAASKNIVSGIGNGKFSPDVSVSRQQMAAILYRYASAYGVTLLQVNPETAFADAVDIAEWAVAPVKAMQMAGILQGKENNRFAPTDTATRAQVAVMLHRFVEGVEATQD